jgi:peptidyl-prolyl cis-trans isomerase A (cyclophilin A)
MIPSILRNFKIGSLIAVFLLLGAQSGSATTVRVITSLGDFSIELFDDVTPITVANFLNYVNSGRYNGTAIHRAVVIQGVPFVIQGGWLSYDQGSNSLNAIATDTEIPNEFALPNTRGTVAMAKLAGDPNSATSQWFVNLSDNSANLDAQNGGFTVFGRVLGDGMDIVDSIAALPTYTLTGIEDFPLFNYSGAPINSSNFVNIAVVVEEVEAEPNFIDESTGLLRITVDAGTAGIAAMSFSITAMEPEVVITLDLSSVQLLSDTVDKIATFDATSGELFLPELAVSGVPAFKNLRFSLSDPQLLVFTLESFEPL